MCVGRTGVSQRDRFVDLVRAFSISMVVIGHWLAAVVVWQDDAITGENVLNLVEELWPLTWLFQVMPLFFFVGGFSNLKRWDSVRRRGGGYVQYLEGRAARLLIPTYVFLAVGLASATVLQAAGLLDRVLRPATHVATLPLWFLGVYLLVVAAGPAMLHLHRRFGVRLLAIMAPAVLAIDAVRFGWDLEAVGYLNYPLVWLGVHQLGFFYADGTLMAWRRWLTATGLAALVLLLAFGPYPSSLVGLAADEIDNMNPPTLPIAALAVTQVGIALSLRSPLRRWLERERAWRAVVAMNGVIMTVFLWHLAAVIPTAIGLYPAGFPQPEAGSGLWYALRPVWMGCLAVTLAVLVLLFGRFEALGRRVGDSIRRHDTPAGVAAAAVGGLYSAYAVVGFGRIGFEPLSSHLVRNVVVFEVTAVANVVYLVVGGGLLAAAAAGSGTVRRTCVAAAVGLLTLTAAGWAVSELALTPALAAVHAGLALVLLAAARRTSPTAAQTRQLGSDEPSKG